PKPCVNATGRDPGRRIHLFFALLNVNGEAANAANLGRARFLAGWIMTETWWKSISVVTARQVKGDRLWHSVPSHEAPLRLLRSTARNRVREIGAKGVYSTVLRSPKWKSRAIACGGLARFLSLGWSLPRFLARVSYQA